LKGGEGRWVTYRKGKQAYKTFLHAYIEGKQSGRGPHLNTGVYDGPTVEFLQRLFSHARKGEDRINEKGNSQRKVTQEVNRDEQESLKKSGRKKKRNEKRAFAGLKVYHVSEGAGGIEKKGNAP